MRVHVELRYETDGFIARYRKQQGFRGELHVNMRMLDGIERTALGVWVEPKPGFPNERPPGPELLDPKAIFVFGDEIRFEGTAAFEDGVWRRQVWDVIILFDPHRKTFPLPY